MFDIYTTIDLSYIGPDWKDCYLKFYPFTIKDVEANKDVADLKGEEAGKRIGEILSEKFVSGYAISDGKRVEVNKETVKQFPMAIMMDIIDSFSTGLPKKKDSKLETSSGATESLPSPS